MEKTYTFYVPDMVCGGCSKRLKKGLIQQLQNKGLIEERIICEPLKHRVIITPSEHTPISAELINHSLKEIGFPAYRVMLDPAQKKCEQRRFLKRIFVAGIGMMQVQMFSVAVYLQLDMPATWIQSFHWFSLWLTTSVMAYCGRPFFVSAISALLERSVNMDVPVVLALSLAYLYSLWATWTGNPVVYFDSINMFLLFITTGRFLEWRARHHAQKATDALWAMVPEKAQKQLPDGSTQWVEVRSLKIADHVLVGHGESIPADLDLISEHTKVDESLLTGEARPISKKQGDKLFAGTINLGATLHGAVSHTAEQTRLGQIQQRLLQAQATRPRLAQWADTVAGYFTLALLLFSALVAATWYWLDPSRVIPVTISVLIVTCPCALSLATPAALTAAMARLARQGIVVSRSNALEKILAITHYVFDKTGTLTEGNFALTETRRLDSLTKNEVLTLAAAIELGETHPIARAFSAWKKPDSQVENKKIHPGIGLSADINGTRYYLGSGHGIRSLCPDISQLQDMAHNQNATCIFLATEDKWLASFTLSDSLRPEAKSVIQRLLLQHKVTLLSGDHEDAVGHVAHELGITEYQARCLPETKQSVIAQLMAQGDCVAMIGDGANDGPVLAQADVGIAMGGGTALAQASADLILLNPNLGSLQQLEHTAKETKHIIKQNMLWALGYNATAIPFAALGLVPAWLAAIGMSLSSLLVVSNSLRLLPKEKQTQKLT